MRLTWENAFSENPQFNWSEPYARRRVQQIRSLSLLKDYLDCVQARYCLLKPFLENEDYPLVESRELLPSFDADPYEYANLPGFSMVALDRPLDYFDEIFQFDILHTPTDQLDAYQGKACPLERTVHLNNLDTLLNRMPRRSQESFHENMSQTDVCDLVSYPALLPYLLQMDRAHVMAKDLYDTFHLCGVYASFPSDLDSELKRFGLRIGKFSLGNNDKYERNRQFVYQFLMELYGFPIVSERRTSSALFARRLHRIGEDFMIRVLGQSDRTITTLYSDPEERRYPKVEKLALVRVDREQKETINYLADNGFFIDKERQAVIMRVIYAQHKYNPTNVRQERALSLEQQEIIHPITCEKVTHLNIIKDVYNMFLRLNDITRGEYVGRIVYKRNEVVENTDTHEKRLKFLYAWLSKHQRRIIGYSDEFFAKVSKVLDSYLLSPENYDTFSKMNDLYREVWAKYSYIQQARKVKVLEDLQNRTYRGNKVDYLQALQMAAELMHELKFEIVNYFDELVIQAISICKAMLQDRYLVRNYRDKKDEELTGYGLDVKKYYGRLASQLDEFKAIRKSRADKDESVAA